MKFRLTIHPDIEEELAVSVKKDSALINKAKELVSEYNGEGKIIAFTEDDIKLLSPSEIECVMVNDGFSAALTGAVNVIFKSGYTDYASRRCFAEIKKELKSK